MSDSTDRVAESGLKYRFGSNFTIPLLITVLLVNILLFATNNSGDVPILRWAFVISWIGSPVLVLADIYLINKLVEWSPKTSYWIVGSIIPFVNVGVIFAYLLRRTEAVRNERWQRWHLVALATLAVSVGGHLLESARHSGLVTKTFDTEVGLISVVALFLAIPAFVFFDGRFLCDTDRWNEDPMGWALLTSLPGIQIFTVPLYLSLRYVKLRSHKLASVLYN